MVTTLLIIGKAYPVLSHPRPKMTLSSEDSRSVVRRGSAPRLLPRRRHRAVLLPLASSSLRSAASITPSRRSSTTRTAAAGHQLAGRTAPGGRRRDKVRSWAVAGESAGGRWCAAPRRRGPSCQCAVLPSLHEPVRARVPRSCRKPCGRDDVPSNSPVTLPGPHTAAPALCFRENYR